VKLKATALWCIACSCVSLVLLTPAAAQSAAPESERPATKSDELVHYVLAVPRSPSDYVAITGKERLQWFVRATVGPKNLAAGLPFAGIGTAADVPHEYGTHWVGFGQRYGMRLTGISTGNAIEASMGAIWGEDPRYFHTVHQQFGARAKNVADLTFRAYGRDGERHPAYARFLAEFGNNFLSNTWRVPSESDWQHALIRTSEGFGGRALSNAFNEFVPEVWRKVRHRPDPYPADLQRP
jgi:hypothetical protein